PYYESGDALDFRLLVYHQGESASNAFDVFITDVLPSTVVWDGQVQSNLPGMVVETSELPTVKFTIPQLPLQYTEANPLEIRYRVSLTSTLKDGEVSTNTARMVWSSVPGNPLSIIPGDNSTSERVGDFASATDPVNDYLAEDEVSFSNGFLVAWEDLRSGKQTNDFDYNDLVLSVENAEFYNTNDELTSLSLKITPVARGALYDHEARLDLGIAGGATLMIKRYGTTGTLLSEEVVQGSGFPIRKVVLFPSTQEVLPPWNGPANGFSSNTSSQQTADIATPAGYTTVEVLVNNPGLNPRIPDFPETRHLNEHNASLYGFSIFIKTTNQTVYLPWGFNAATYDIVTSANNPGSPLVGFPLTQAISVPVNWRHPFERTKVWVSHPLFVDYIFSGQTEYLDWAVDSTDSTRLWPKDKSKDGAKLTEPLDAVKVGIPITGSPVLADLNDNGVNEIVLGLFDGSIRIYEFQDDSLTSRTVTPEGVGESKGSVLVANLDSDEELEMVRGDENGKLFFLDTDGSLLTQPLQLQGTIKSTPVCGDINGDGVLDVVVQTGDGLLYAFNKSFLPLSGFPVNLGGTKDEGGHSYFTPSPVLASLLSSSQLDIITVNLSGTARIVSGSGATLPGWPVELNSETEATPVVLNVDGDTEPEIAFASLDGFIHVLNHDGSSVPSWPVRRFFGGVSSPAAADVTGDGRDELFVGSSDGRIYGFSPEGTRLAGFPFFTGSAIHASPSMGNLDADETPELLIASTDGKLYRVDFEGDKPTSSVVDDFETFAVTTTAIGSLYGESLQLVLGTHTGELVIRETGTQAGAEDVLWSGFRGRETGNALNGELPVLPTTSISAWGFY
ncbi:MAG: LruC domain-containing protein, partial [Candidatus Sumerlaeia bacterium]|nr:LruC domain-containing protein [Candidatus Sumerlaeia bacterium]